MILGVCFLSLLVPILEAQKLMISPRFLSIFNDGARPILNVIVFLAQPNWKVAGKRHCYRSSKDLVEFSLHSPFVVHQRQFRKRT